MWDFTPQYPVRLCGICLRHISPSVWDWTEGLKALCFTSKEGVNYCEPFRFFSARQMTISGSAVYSSVFSRDYVEKKALLFSR